MTALRPFFLLLSRASVFWLGAFAVPAGFKPILEPEFPWSYFDDGSAPPPRK